MAKKKSAKKVTKKKSARKVATSAKPKKERKITKKTGKKSKAKASPAKKKAKSSSKKASSQPSLLGQRMEDFPVIITDGKKSTLKKLSGKKGLVLYFYPRDNTPGCTTEACNFRDHLPELKKAGYEVAGVSADSIESHRKFTDKQGLNFPLVADTDLQLCKAFFAYGLKKFMGREYMGIIRKTFVLDKNLNVILEYPKVKVKEHAKEILQDLAKLDS